MTLEDTAAAGSQTVADTCMTFFRTFVSVDLWIAFCCHSVPKIVQFRAILSIFWPFELLAEHLTLALTAPDILWTCPGPARFVGARRQ